MTGNQFSGDVGHLSEDETGAFARATDIYRALIAVIDARIDREPDPANAQMLREAAASYAAEQRALSATDNAGVQQVIDQYPALVREHQDALTR